MAETDINRAEPWRDTADRRLPIIIEQSIYRMAMRNAASFGDEKVTGHLFDYDEAHSPPLTHPFMRLNDIELIVTINNKTDQPGLKAMLLKDGSGILAESYPVEALHVVVCADVAGLSRQLPDDTGLAYLAGKFGRDLYAESADRNHPHYSPRNALEIATIMKYNPQLDLDGRSADTATRMDYFRVWKQRQKDMVALLAESKVRAFWRTEELTAGDQSLSADLLYCFNFMVSETGVFSDPTQDSDLGLLKLSLQVSRLLLDYYVRAGKYAEATYVAMYSKGKDPAFADHERWLKRLF